METLRYMAVDRRGSDGDRYELTVQLSGGGAGMSIPRGLSADLVIRQLRSFADELEYTVGLRRVDAPRESEGKAS